MAGHSHWAGIKHKKGALDQKRGVLFSKLLRAISVAAKQEPNPQFNPQLKTAVEKAKENQVPQEKIENAIKRANEAADNLEELAIEAYGPEGAAILIEAITDNKNRTISELKKSLSESGAKIAEPGSVLWAFESKDGDRQAKFKQEISNEGRGKIEKLMEDLKERGDVQKIYINV